MKSPRDGLWRMNDFEIRHAPALIAHVHGHEAEAFGLDLPRTGARGWGDRTAGLAAP
jgi:hypothetical protein